jgi:thioredoxin reductase (NADPH)
MPGVFAVGDVRHGSGKRVAASVGDGSVAVRLLHEYLAQLSEQEQLRA